jgi:hypothetical protein
MSVRHEEKSRGTVLQEVKSMRTLAIHAMPRCAPVRLRSRACEHPLCYVSVRLGDTLPLPYAQGLAEDYARHLGVARRVEAEAPWRQPPATEKQTT